MLSPSPFSLAFYAALALYATFKLYRIYGHNYKRLKPLVALSDAVLMVGFVVVLLDTVWIITCMLRFGWAFPSSVLQLVACLFRNLGIVMLCYVFEKDYLRDRATQWTFITFVANVAFMAVWFWLSPSPAYTDWTFAFRNGYPLTTVLTSFLISHVIGKALVASMFLSYWKN